MKITTTKKELDAAKVSDLMSLQLEIAAAKKKTLSERIKAGIRISREKKQSVK